MQQVILNLVMNGIEAMRETGDRPRVLMLKSQIDDEREVSVTVVDSGTGFNSANFGHIFEAFFTTKAEGMGMGLSICNSIVRAHGGRMSATGALLMVPSFALLCLQWGEPFHEQPIRCHDRGR